ncbi:unnamed protein product [Blepharisma stoltei]|uniref:Uncharacterized protein n=1 Tax=Blepharisma stoltei TaxID=1481888 RepID=A0AAU9J2Z9_9CILI|nr:unnamed protein product [Blepharisma stoltei]
MNSNISNPFRPKNKQIHVLHRRKPRLIYGNRPLMYDKSTQTNKQISLKNISFTSLQDARDKIKATKLNAKNQFLCHTDAPSSNKNANRGRSLSEQYDRVDNFNENIDENVEKDKENQLEVEKSVKFEETPNVAKKINSHEKRVTICTSVTEIHDDAEYEYESSILKTGSSRTNRTKDASLTPFNFTHLTSQDTDHKSSDINTENSLAKIEFVTPQSNSVVLSETSSILSSETPRQLDEESSLKRKCSDFPSTDPKDMKRRKLNAKH